MDLVVLSDWMRTGVTLFVGAAAGYLGLRKRYSRDTAEITHDKAESGLIETLMRERLAALELAKGASDARLEDGKALARFEERMRQCDKETSRLGDEIFTLRLHVRHLTAIIVKLDPQAAGLLQLNASGDGVDRMDDRRIASTHPPDGVTP